MIQTHRSLKTTFRPQPTEVLEDRAVPSTLAASTSVSAQLGKVQANITAAYSAFATSIYAAETTLIDAGGANASALATSIGQATTTLNNSVTSAVSGTIVNNLLGLYQEQINGSIPGSLLSGMEKIVGAAALGSPTASIAPVSFPLLVTALEAEISSAFNAATIQTTLYGEGPAVHAASNLNLPVYNADASSIYNLFAQTVLYTEFTLFTSDGSAAPPAYTSNAVLVIDSRLGGVAQGISNLLFGTSEASRALTLRTQLVGSTPGSLIYQLNSLFGASASPDGSIAQDQLRLLTASVDAALNAAYTVNSVEGYILALS